MLSFFAELRFADLPGGFPYALVLPQNVFEDALEQRLLTRNKTEVLWNHRLSDLQFAAQSVVASIDKLAQTAKGYIVADWDWTVQKKLETTAAFVVGADGHDSMVRSRLGIDYESLGNVEQFAVFEFETDSEPGHEMRIAMDDTTTNVLWPLADGRCRWTFQLVKTTDAGEFPAKDRESMRIIQGADAERARRTVERLARTRAPWFKGNVKDILWSARIRFEHCLVNQFGKGRAWLAGDAAHQTGPVGVQSMNEGLLEAEHLSDTLKKILREGASLRLLENYDHVHQALWNRLRLKDGDLRASALANSWIDQHAGRIGSCIPASGGSFAPASEQLGIKFEALASVERQLN